MKWRRAAGIELLHFMWMTLPRRRRLSSDLEQQHQVFGFFLHFHVAVAQDAEHAPAGNGVAGKQLVEIKRDDFFQRNEAHPLFGVGQADEAAQLRRHRDQGGEVLAVAPVGQRQRDGEAQIGNEGKRMRRIDRQRRQHRENLLGELGVQTVAVARRESPRRSPR